MRAKKDFFHFSQEFAIGCLQRNTDALAPVKLDSGDGSLPFSVETQVCRV